MEFLAPIHLRDLISVYAEVERVGRTSMGVRIEVIASRDRGATEVKVTEGLFTFVALDDREPAAAGRRRPTPTNERPPAVIRARGPPCLSAEWVGAQNSSWARRRRVSASNLRLSAGV